MELPFPLRFPETTSGWSTNRNKAVCLWVSGYVPTPTCYPTLGMYFKRIKYFLMITGRCRTWCTIHRRNGPACVISISYGSIKHFIIKHYSKQTVSLKGEGEDNKMSECSFYPLYHHIFIVCTVLKWNHNPNTKIDLKEINRVSVHPGTFSSSFFFFDYLNSYNMMVAISYIFPIMLDGWIFERWWRSKGGMKGADVQLGCSFGIYTQMWAPLR